MIAEKREKTSGTRFSDISAGKIVPFYRTAISHREIYRAHARAIARSATRCFRMESERVVEREKEMDARMNAHRSIACTCTARTRAHAPLAD